MLNFNRSVLVAALALSSTAASAQVTFYDQEGVRGRTFTTDRQIANLQRYGGYDAASSAARKPLRTAPSMVAGKPVFVQSPAT